MKDPVARRALGQLRDIVRTGEELLRRLFGRWIKAKVERDSLVEESCVNEFREDIATVLAVSDLVGRKVVLRHADAEDRRHGVPSPPRDTEPPVEAPPAPEPERGTVAATRVPRIEFREAVDDLLTRNPALAKGYEEVQRAYARGHAFALAKSTDDVLTWKVKDVLAEEIRTGSGQERAIKAIAKLGGWTEEYSALVYQMNAANAYTAGQFRQMRDPDVRGTMLAFEFVSIHDAGTRDNHEAASGLIAAADDPIWDTFAPPLGYRCRCSLRAVSKFELADQGLLLPDGRVRRYMPPGFGAAHPDPGFGVGRVGTRLGLG